MLSVFVVKHSTKLVCVEFVKFSLSKHVPLCCRFGVPLVCFFQVYRHTCSMLVAITNIVHSHTESQKCTLFVQLKCFRLILTNTNSKMVPKLFMATPFPCSVDLVDHSTALVESCSVPQPYLKQ